MEYIKFLVVVALLSIFNLTESFSQKNDNSDIAHTIFLGYPATIFDAPDLGIYLGYNMEIIKKDRFSWEGQASAYYASYDEDSGIFAHDGGNTFVASLLFGPRVYIMKPERNIRWYFSFLPGIAFVDDQEYGFSEADQIVLRREASLKIGYNVGSYLQFRDRLIFGASYEQYGALVFKVGYKIPNSKL